MTAQEKFDGLAFPVIRVTLGNNKGRATLHAPGGDYRAVVNYNYAEPDGVTFARKAAEAAWEKYRAASMADEFPYDPGAADTRAFVPGNDKGGYVFIVTPREAVGA